MERDTAYKHDSTSAPLDTFLNEQGTGVPADTQGYSGIERPDTRAVNSARGGGRRLQPLTLPQRTAVPSGGAMSVPPSCFPEEL